MNDPFLFASRRWSSGTPRRLSRAEEERYCRGQREDQARVSAKTHGMGCND